MENQITNLEINPSDVVKLILQYCAENNFVQTLKFLESESGVKLNSVDSISKFKDDVINGRWNLVLQVIDGVEIHSNVLVDLYEQIVFDLIENDDRDVAKLFLYKMSITVNNLLKFGNDEKFSNLEKIINSNISMREIYNSNPDLFHNRTKIRVELADNLAKYVNEIPNGRLVEILKKGISNEIKSSNQSQYNIITGTIDKDSNIPSVVLTDKLPSDDYVKSFCKQINFDSLIKSVKFSPNGVYFATGNSLGSIEIFDLKTWTHSADLLYQTESSFMRHQDSVSALNFNKDSNMICSGDINGIVKVFKLANGKCLREFLAHVGSVSCLTFTKDNSHVITGSTDTTIKILGLRADKVLHEITVHKSFINDLQLTKGGTKFLSASADGTVKVFDTKTYELLTDIDSHIVCSYNQIAVNNIIIHEETVFISNRSNSIYRIDLRNNEILKVFTTEKSKNILFEAVSYDGQWLYAIDEDNILYTFSVKDGVIRNFIKIPGKEIINITVSPVTRLIAFLAFDDKEFENNHHGDSQISGITILYITIGVVSVLIIIIVILIKAFKSKIRRIATRNRRSNSLKKNLKKTKSNKSQLENVRSIILQDSLQGINIMLDPNIKNKGNKTPELNLNPNNDINTDRFVNSNFVICPKVIDKKVNTEQIDSPNLIEVKKQTSKNLSNGAIEKEINDKGNIISNNSNAIRDENYLSKDKTKKIDDLDLIDNNQMNQSREVLLTKPLPLKMNSIKSNNKTDRRDYEILTDKSKLSFQAQTHA